MSQQRADTLRVGLLQTAPVFGEVEANIRRILEMRENVGYVDLALTPELSVNGYGFGTGADYRPLQANDQRLRAFANQSGAMGIGFAETVGDGNPRNAYLITGAEERHHQQKIHPVSYAPWNEHLGFDAGDAVDTAVIGGARCATVICNDMWHPVIPWLAAQAGAEVLIVPVASIEGANAGQVQRTWQVILEHAALLLQCYVVFINRCGTDGGAKFWGQSRILAPDGSVVAAAGSTETALTANLNLAALRSLRARTPLLAEARHDVVLNTLSRRTLTEAALKGHDPLV
ncbi:carbon-nitrogen hydrolase family protein [Arthrobacter globiformis]|uniref:carbon-nitrogen hydrolase family protein n=1 Tax=Arthrobacter globiformis TaxID=1665 RepID=UPI0027D82AAA|nr:nitrilase-related carbon-nitrogen hydrolase [Arthrobacter globiformis]